jgi:NTP pyrophosphatase (non-canonical NTP hydrolase)
MQEREHPPILDSLHQIQAAEAGFSAILNPTETPEEIFGMVQNELTELHEVLPGGDRQDIAAEMADVFLLLSKLATYYSIPLEEAISAKINRNFNKYNPYEIKKLQDSGMTPKEAVLFRRTEWDRSLDKKFAID